MEETGFDERRLDIRVGSATHTGLVREGNEDTLLADRAMRLFVVADGMGGHLAGEVASRIAVETIQQSIRRAPATAGPIESLQGALESAHRAIKESAEADPRRRGMGTALAALWIPPESPCVWVAHVGDCRCYLFRDGRIERLTDDHTLYNQLARAGLLPSDTADRPSPHTLTQSLGASDVIAPEVKAVRTRAGDLFLLCSDGLTDMVDDDRLAALIAASSDPQALCDELVAEANRGGGRDNITVIAVLPQVGLDMDHTSVSCSPSSTEE